MEKLLITGGNVLTGTIKVSGAKNSVVALIPAAILSDEEVTIYNVPNISDTNSLIDILTLLGAEVDYNDETMKINNQNIKNQVISEELSSKLRASYYFMGALLGKYKKCEIYFPGGCNIGARPIDLHLKGFEKMGATISVDGDKYIIEAQNLKGARVYLDIASVGATINIMLAATKAEGTTIISNAAKEPEIANIATFLNNMGAKISGAGTSEIKIIGVKELSKKGIIEVIPDRIEAGTYIIAGALSGKNLIIDCIIKEHLEALLSKLKEIGIPMILEENRVTISASKNLTPVNIKTLVHPGFPTDLGQPIQVLLTQIEGDSLFEETIFETRMGHVKHLEQMGAKYNVSGCNAVISGATPLTGAKVVATDLRGGAAMVLAGLIASGTTEILDIEHILRGYENVVEKLTAVGAKIEIAQI